jgi:two-component system cell cycle response regulator
MNAGSLRSVPVDRAKDASTAAPAVPDNEFMGALVLIIDDSATLRGQIKQTLQSTNEFDRFVEADNGLTGFKLMIEHQPDVVICDLVMPISDGMKFLALRATRVELTQVPVIMLTADADFNRKVEVLDRGASDYVTKPFHDKELLARVRVHFRVKALQDELRDANQRLETLSITDALTGLYNRRYFDSLLLNEVKRTLRYKSPLAVLMIDLDHFKSVNDNYGHQMGDQVLRNVGGIVAAGIRTTDSAARYGGEELVVVLTQTGLPGAIEAAERLRSQIEAAVHTVAGVSIKSTASMGLATFDGNGEALDCAELITRADQALYRAKSGGRNRVVLWQE